TCALPISWAGCTRNPSSGRCTWSTTGAPRPAEYPRSCRRQREAAKMRTVRQLLDGKSPEVYAVAPDAPVSEAIRLMALKSIGAVLGTEAGQLRGILSERAYARKIVLEGRASEGTPVSAIMTCDGVTGTPGPVVRACMQLMTEQRIRHLPVLEGGSVVGIISLGDLVKAVIEDQQYELAQLQRYIAG